MPVQRITMFKIKDDANVQKMIDQYKVVADTNKKDGKPYILSCEATKTIDDPRSQGYTLVARSRFNNLEDMKFYDEECEAHKQLKELAKGKIEPPPLTLYFEV